MEHRPLGRTGVSVSKLCLGAMMFGAWGNPDHDESIRIIHAALDAGINFIDTADVYARGESEEIVGKALAGGRRDDVVLATKFHGPMGDDPNQQGSSRRWIIREVEDSLRRLRHRLDRPLPGPPPADRTPTSRRRSARSPTSSTRARSATSATRRSRPARSSRRSGSRASATCSASSPSSRRTRSSCARIEADVLPTCAALRHGRHLLQPAGRRLAVGPLAQGRRPAGLLAREPAARALRPLPARQPAQARRGRAARAARRRGRDHAHRAGDRVRAQPPGDHRGDHRPAHHGAAREPARRRRRRPRRRPCSTASTRSSPPGTTVNPVDNSFHNPALEPSARRR